MPSTETPAAPVTAYVIKPRPAAWQALRKSVDLEADAALADVIGVDRSNVYRVLTGQAEPSQKFIAHTLHAFPFASFDRLFTVAAKSATR